MTDEKKRPFANPSDERTPLTLTPSILQTPVALDRRSQSVASVDELRRHAIPGASSNESAPSNVAPRQAPPSPVAFAAQPPKAAVSSAAVRLDASPVPSRPSPAPVRPQTPLPPARIAPIASRAPAEVPTRVTPRLDSGPLREPTPPPNPRLTPLASQAPADMPTRVTPQLDPAPPRQSSPLPKAPEVDAPTPVKAALEAPQARAPGVSRWAGDELPTRVTPQLEPLPRNLPFDNERLAVTTVAPHAVAEQAAHNSEQTGVVRHTMSAQALIDAVAPTVMSASPPIPTWGDQPTQLAVPSPASPRIEDANTVTFVDLGSSLPTTRARALPMSAPGDIVARPASLWRRTLAWAIDLGAIGSVVLAFLSAAALVSGSGASLQAKLFSLAKVAVPGAILAALLALVYTTLFAMVGQGRTLGRRALGIHLVDGTGQAPGPLRALLRAGLALVSFGLFLAGFWLALFDRKGQTLHDKLARTYVVRLG